MYSPENWKSGIAIFLREILLVEGVTSVFIRLGHYCGKFSCSWRITRSLAFFLLFSTFTRWTWVVAILQLNWLKRKLPIKVRSSCNCAMYQSTIVIKVMNGEENQRIRDVQLGTLETNYSRTRNPHSRVCTHRPPAVVGGSQYSCWFQKLIYIFLLPRNKSTYITSVLS